MNARPIDTGPAGQPADPASQSLLTIVVGDDEEAPPPTVPFSAVHPRLELAYAGSQFWAAPCPACSEALDVFLDGDGAFAVYCQAACDRNKLAAALGVTLTNLNAGFINDVPEVAAAPLDFEEPFGDGDVDRARLVLRHVRSTGRELAHTTESGWLLWTGTTWNPARDSEVRAIIIEVADLAEQAAARSHEAARRATFADAKPHKDTAARAEKLAVALKRIRSIDAVLRVLESLPGVRLSLVDFDTDADVLGVANGVVDLRTGTLRPYTRADRITRASPVAFDPAATAPRWELFLEEVFLAEERLPDPEYVAFMRRLVGYGITGSTREHVLPVLYGRGGNGKSVFIETVQDVFTAHTVTTPFQTFEAQPSGGIPNDLAAMRGARLVMASEGGAGRPMDEGVLKRLTGGDTIAARFMRGEFFNFSPAFLIMLATNHRPNFRGQDEGLWRRVKLLPFRADYQGTARDEGLKGYLLEHEREGILAWAVRGAGEWLSDGLRVPASIEAETASYRSESDRLGDFLAERFEITGGHYDVVSLSDAWKAYTDWADEERETTKLQRKGFGDMLGERPGITKATRSKVVIYRGVNLYTDAERRQREAAAARAERPLALVAAEGAAPW